ncbi:hypothetical protein DFH09DRAFT_1177839 [Mycena vulgaris]|nr:hypothetical protein DFH09DRAFT_1177839 [Mycena vulgaris]
MCTGVKWLHHRRVSCFGLNVLLLYSNSRSFPHSTHRLPPIIPGKVPVDANANQSRRGNKHDRRLADPSDLNTK